MDGLGDVLLAGTGLAADQHRGARRSGDSACRLGHFQECRRRPDHALQGDPAGALAEYLDVAAQALGLEGATHLFANIVQVEGLDQVVVGAGAQRRHRAAHLGKGGHHHHLDVVVHGADPGQHLEAVDARQVDIEQHQVDALPFQDIQAVLPGPGPAHRIAAPLEHVAEGLADGLVVVDDEDVLGHGG